MNLTDCYASRSDDVAWEDFDGEFVVLDLANGKYFSLLGAAAIVWRVLTSGHSVESLCAALLFDDNRRAEIISLVDSLLAHNLIVVAPAPATDPPDDVPADLAGASGPFVVEMFDDLADLLLADPIHDVDPETGWPVLRPD